MKTILALVVLAVIATVSDSSAIPTSARANLAVGSIAASDRLLFSNYYYKAAIFNAIQYEDVIYRGTTATRITAVRAYEVGPTQWANAYIRQGGINQNNVTIRFTSSQSRGYYYQLQIYGR